MRILRTALVWLLSAAVLAAPALAQQAAPVKGVAAALQPFVDREVLAGAVTLVADRNKVLEVDIVGWADREARRPMTEDSLFWIASMSKPITAAALMLLVDQGL